MTDDLVARLRRDRLSPLCELAADEIELLLGEIERLRKLLGKENTE